jgi:hypothetical protein
VNQHVGCRQPFGQAVVIGDDELKADLAGHVGLGHTGDPAVDRDDQVSSIGLEPPESVGIEAIPFVESVWHIPAGLGMNRLQTVEQDGGGRHAVGVVVAVDHNLPASFRCGQNAVGRVGHTDEFLGFPQVRHRGIEKSPGCGRIGDPSGSEEPGDDWRDAS